MRITRVNILKDRMYTGLEEVNMNNLGKYVVIAGKNGAGKSRLLSIISADFQTQVNLHKNFDNYEISGGLRTINNLKFQSYKLENPKEASQSKYSMVMDNLSSGILNPSQLVNALILICDVHEKYLHATHQLNIVSDEKKKETIQNYTKLNNIIKQLLDTEIGYNGDFYSTLFGLSLDQCSLSDGQSALLQIAVLLYTQEIKLEDVVIFLDEPEIHLHPSALNLVIDRLGKCIINGQIWIATHSVALLAHIASKDPSAIWYMENGKIEFGGRIPEKVLESLIGDAKGIEELQDFCSLPAQYATTRFALECLEEAQTVGAKEGDKQTCQIVDSLREAVGLGKTVKIVDFGAGKGRLADAIYYWARSEAIENIAEIVDYIAFDEYKDDKEICETAISRIYGHADGRYFNDLQNFQIKVDRETVDFIVSCNVLHEIPVSEWHKYLDSTGLFHTLLTENGEVIWIEDRLMPKGEKAHRNGFIVFGPLQIKELFNITGNALKFSYADEHERLMKCNITKNQLLGFSTENLKEALRKLKEHSESRVKKLRNDPYDFKKGKEHGFWSQQYINAILSLEELGG